LLGEANRMDPVGSKLSSSAGGSWPSWMVSTAPACAPRLELFSLLERDEDSLPCFLEDFLLDLLLSFRSDRSSVFSGETGRMTETRSTVSTLGVNRGPVGGRYAPSACAPCRVTDGCGVIVVAENAAEGLSKCIPYKSSPRSSMVLARDLSTDGEDRSAPPFFFDFLDDRDLSGVLLRFPDASAGGAVDTGPSACAPIVGVPAAGSCFAPKEGRVVVSYSDKDLSSALLIVMGRNCT
jgi:hypothetical protein